MFNNFMPTPLMNAYQSPTQMYAQGGMVHPRHQYHHEAEMLRSMGTGRDRILAHINPAEASYLSHSHGMSINPHTGLPQFGLWDSLRSGLGAVGAGIGQLGRQAIAAAPGVWNQYGRPLAEQGLQALDTRIQGALPGLAQSLGTRFGGERGGAIGASFGQNLANQFGQAGGLTGQALPRMDARTGMPTQGPMPINAGQMAANIGRGVWGDVGRNMAHEGLINADMRLMNAIQPGATRLGGAIGSRFGRGEQGAAFGSQLGGNIAEAYGQSPGISGYAMPRMNRAVQNMGIPMAPPPPPMPGMAQGGPVYAQGGYVDPMDYMYPNY